MGLDSLYWIWLSERLGAGSKDAVELVNIFGSPFDVYNATEEELVRSQCITERTAHKLSDKDLSDVRRIIDYCVLNNVGILTYSNEFYPSRLKTLKDPPCVLYYKGTLPDFNNKVCIAIVGTRKMSEYGKRTAFKIGYELGAADAVVVSGMALGNDSVAACGAICGGGKTVAVLGCGIDLTYPPEHIRLRRIIEDNGVVISEYAPGTKPFGVNFPIRNRIISGLCQGTLIVEADDRSGALITARCALMQGRDVYALPGNIDEINAQGPNQLIRDGANTVLEAKDILENYNLLYGSNINYLALAYAKERYFFDEAALKRMAVSSKPYHEKNSIKNDETPKASKMRPLRRAKLSERDDLPSTVEDKKKSKKNEFQIERQNNAEEIIAQLGETERTIFSEMPMDRAISMDALCSLGYTVGDVMSALTLLEVKGLVTSLPGSLYIRK